MINTTSYMVAGLLIVFLSISFYIVSLIVRYRSMVRQEQIMLDDDETSRFEHIED